ncbi:MULTISPECIES: hypothetical protein [unclassified Streptomyces]|uniref:hypothetical protein n=1 Tax=unclassified Streptomyces TaxID=2593676 RepID=UPI003D7528D8
MTEYRTWAEAKRRIRASQPGVSDADWKAREQAARKTTEMSIVAHHRIEQGIDPVPDAP